MAEMKPFTLEKLVCPTPHDSSTRKTKSACTTVLHAEETRVDKLVHESKRGKSKKMNVFVQRGKENKIQEKCLLSYSKEFGQKVNLFKG